jgi:hypothetical protein
MRFFELDQRAQQRVVFGIGNLRIVENVVAIVRLVDPFAQLTRAAAGGAQRVAPACLAENT